jgi:hypothetical protein
MKSKFGFSEDQVKNSGNPFPVGEKVDDVEITDCKYSSGQNKMGVPWEAIDVTYTRAGTSINDRIFSINEDSITVRPWLKEDTVEAATEDAYKTLNTQLLHIATKLGLTSDDLNKMDRSTFYTMANAYCSLIMDNCKGVKLYMKTIPDGNYTRVARTSSSAVPFLHRMGDGECTLKYTTSELGKIASNVAPANGVTMKQNVDPAWVPTKV